MKSVELMRKKHESASSRTLINIEVGCSFPHHDYEDTASATGRVANILFPSSHLVSGSAPRASNVPTTKTSSHSLSSLRKNV